MDWQDDRLTDVRVAPREVRNDLSEKIAKICANLRPFQALDYDPASGKLVLMTEWLIPSSDVECVTNIITHRKADERITVRRFEDNYKVALIKCLNV